MFINKTYLWGDIVFLAELSLLVCIGLIVNCNVSSTTVRTSHFLFSLYNKMVR